MATRGGRANRAVPGVRTPKQRAGAAAEQAAADYLPGHGLVLVARNARYPEGELDLILRERDALVFVEVRMRSATAFPDGQKANASELAGTAATVATATLAAAATLLPVRSRFKSPVSPTTGDMPNT